MKNGGRLFRRSKLSLSCSAKGKEGRKYPEDIVERRNVVT
jgi:hypothetical protein